MVSQKKGQEVVNIKLCYLYKVNRVFQMQRVASWSATSGSRYDMFLCNGFRALGWSSCGTCQQALWLLERCIDK